MLGLSRKKRAVANRRRFERIADETSMIIVNGVSYAVADWSIDGFRALGYRGGFSPGDEARGRLVIVHAGRPMGFNVDLRILRESEHSGEFSGCFPGMTDESAKNLERVYTQKLQRQRAKTGR